MLCPNTLDIQVLKDFIKRLLQLEGTLASSSLCYRYPKTMPHGSEEGATKRLTSLIAHEVCSPDGQAAVPSAWAEMLRLERYNLQKSGKESIRNVRRFTQEVGQ